MTPLESLVIEWTAAHMTIANECLRTRGKGLVITPEMVIRLRNAERSLLDFARNISPVTNNTPLEQHPLSYQSELLKQHIEQTRTKPDKPAQNRTAAKPVTKNAKAAGPSNLLPPAAIGGSS